ncbi:MAG TPA: protein translocase subunit SecD [Candidatus Binatia bacterium]|nr:protein translocase subunit SecD [Candidatus Binatia bacterium]
MNRSILTRLLLFAGLALATVVVLLPTFVHSLPRWWPWRQPVRLGLDLQGGTHLLYHVDIDQAVDNVVDRDMQDLENELRQAQIGATDVSRDGHTVRIKLANKDKRRDVEDLVRERIPTLVPAQNPDVEAADLTYTIDPKEERRVRDNVVDQALKIIRNRIDQFGVAEPTVVAQGSDEIVVQLPGIQDPQRAKDLIGKTAVLEFKLLAANGQGGSLEHPAPGYQALPGKGEGGRRTTYLVEKRVLMTGDMVKNATIAPASQTEGMAVEFELDARGAAKFGEVTTQNVGRNLAIVLDGVVESAPTIREPIRGGHGQITGRFDFAEAQDLANVLRNGALPAPLKLEEERSVGPSLGKDSINKGVLSFALGTGAVILFMVLYYRGGGLIADMALVLNVFFLVGALAALGATLSLPGIAGIVLTVGMAVDANVLILERIREELRLGKSVRAAVDAGYDRAWHAIRDSNLTTALSGVILFFFGTGPIAGFAVTLLLGIASSLLTGFVGTRIVYDILMARRRLTTVSV